jgi:hypothetical protein
MNRVIRSELVKLRTSNAWWLMALGALLLVAVAFLFAWLAGYFTLNPPELPPPPQATAEQQAETARMNAEQQGRAAQRGTLLSVTADLFTAGQFFGSMFVMLLGALLFTNEFFHQTATATFLATPRRGLVIAAKFVTVVFIAVTFWVVFTALDVAAGSAVLSSMDKPVLLGEWPVQRAILLNLAAYALWGVLGVGLGVLIRNQVAAMVFGTILYLIGSFAGVVFFLIRQYLIKQDWVLTAQVALPSEAARIMTTVGQPYPQAAPQWVGAVVMLGYGLLFGMIGAMITKRRDVV